MTDRAGGALEELPVGRAACGIGVSGGGGGSRTCTLAATTLEVQEGPAPRALADTFGIAGSGGQDAGLCSELPGTVQAGNAATTESKKVSAKCCKAGACSCNSAKSLWQVAASACKTEETKACTCCDTEHDSERTASRGTAHAWDSTAKNMQRSPCSVVGKLVSSAAVVEKHRSMNELAAAQSCTPTWSPMKALKDRAGGDPTQPPTM